MDSLAVNLPLAYKAKYGSKQTFEAEVLSVSRCSLAKTVSPMLIARDVSRAFC